MGFVNYVSLISKFSYGCTNAPYKSIWNPMASSVESSSFNVFGANVIKFQIQIVNVTANGHLVDAWGVAAGCNLAIVVVDLLHGDAINGGLRPGSTYFHVFALVHCIWEHALLAYHCLVVWFALHNPSPFLSICGQWWIKLGILQICTHDPW